MDNSMAYARIGNYGVLSKAATPWRRSDQARFSALYLGMEQDLLSGQTGRLDCL